MGNSVLRFTCLLEDGLALTRAVWAYVDAPESGEYVQASDSANHSHESRF